MIESNRLLLSVVIPAHDEAGNLDATVAALVGALREASVPYEVVLVNDNSTDQTGQVAEHLASQDSAIRVITRTRLGGFERATTAGSALVSVARARWSTTRPPSSWSTGS